MRYQFTDELWQHFEPFAQQAKRFKCGVAPALPDRLFFEALLYWARTGIPWRDLPSEFGAWDAVYNRFRRWIHSGSLLQLFLLLTDAPQFGEVRRLLVDSTTVRAHQHAGGAPKKGAAADQGLGRSRGGLSTKIMLSAADESTALSVDLAPGQANDAPLLEPTLAAATARVSVDEVVADRAFAGDPQRQACLDRDLAPQVPNKSNAVEPWPFDAEAYRDRNQIERLINKLKQFRRAATRYDKLRETFLGLLHLVLGFIRAKAIVNTA